MPTTKILLESDIGVEWLAVHWDYFVVTVNPAGMSSHRY